MKTDLNTSVQYLKSVGPKRAEAFKKVGIETVEDLLYYFPSKHLDRRTILNTAKVYQYVTNGYDGEVTLIGIVQNTELIRYGKKQLFKVQMKDNAGFFDCVWFQGIRFFKNLFEENETYAVSGKPVITRYGNLQLAHPDFDKLSDTESKDFTNTGKIIPFYRVSKELKSTKLGDISLRRIITGVVENHAHEITESLPSTVLKKKDLLEKGKAVYNYHIPNSTEELEHAKTRFKYEELFYLQCLNALRKFKNKNEVKGVKFDVHSKPLKKFIDELPFVLTPAQLKVLKEIREDMEIDKPMNRLLQGDVGSGKTIVALIAMLIAVSNGYQAALMAPTEILADQHFKNIHKYLENTNFNAALLIGGQKKKVRETILNGIERKEIDIIIGTHALIEDTVNIPKLGLAVIDEQHRFGVAQRSKLVSNSLSPDVIVMTATPIPRTLSMTIYGDLDISTIDEMPAQRKSIRTALRGESQLEKVFDFIKDRVEQGEQAFVVYPLVEESEKLDLKDVTTHYEKIKDEHLQNLKVGLLHGRMSWKEKEEIMEQFARKEFDILFSTTVIEVGIDIPNASVIVINEAFRFGLSQLHQLRGRVGRSDKQSYCVLITRDEHLRKLNTKIDLEFLSPADIDKYKSQIRLNAMVETNDGFKLAEIDFKLRGPGNIFGTQQSGLPQFKYANLIEDQDLLEEAKQDAFNLITSDPLLTKGENQIVKRELKNNYIDVYNFSNIA